LLFFNELNVLQWLNYSTPTKRGYIYSYFAIIYFVVHIYFCNHFIVNTCIVLCVFFPIIAGVYDRGERRLRFSCFHTLCWYFAFCDIIDVMSAEN